jgi:hypothetical protein
VIVEIEDRLEDDPPLHRTALTAIPAQPPEIFETLSFRILFQVMPSALRCFYVPR